MDQAARITAKEYLTLPPPEDCYLDLDEGEIIEVPFGGVPHGKMRAELGCLLAAAVEDRGLGLVICAEMAFQLNDHTVTCPDVAVFLPAPAINEGPYHGAPEIAIEIVRPNESVNRMNRNRRAYFTAGALEVWVVEPHSRLVEIYTANGTWRTIKPPAKLTTPLIPNWQLNLAEIFD